MFCFILEGVRRDGSHYRHINVVSIIVLISFAYGLKRFIQSKSEQAAPGSGSLQFNTPGGKNETVPCVFADICSPMCFMLTLILI